MSKKRIIIMLSIMCAVCLIVFLLIYKNNLDTEARQEITNYLESNHSHDPAVSYFWGDTVYYGGKEKHFSEFETELGPLGITGINYDILYVTDKHIFFLKSKKGEMQEIYKTDHDLSFFELIHSYNDDDGVHSRHMLNENEIYYVDIENEKYVYYIDTQTLMPCNEKNIFDALKKNGYYTYELLDKKFSRSFAITETATGITKEIKCNDSSVLFKNDVAKYINDKLGIRIDSIYLVDEEIYIVGFSLDLITVYRYDFETEKCELVDWAAMSYDNEDLTVCFFTPAN